MLLAWIKRSLPAACLLLVASCGTAPAPDVNDVRGSMSLQIFEKDPTYPKPVVEAFKQFDVPLSAIETRSQEPAILGRVTWEVTHLDSRCDVAVAIRRAGNWRNYAYAGNGSLINGTANWWGEAQKQHRDIREDLALDPNAASALDTFWTGVSISRGEALFAWYVDGPFRSQDVDALEGYVVYGCGNYRSVLA